MPDHKKPLGPDTDGCTGDEGDRTGITLIFPADIVGDLRRLDRDDLIDDVGKRRSVSRDSDGISDTDFAQAVKDRTIPAHPMPEDHEISGASCFTIASALYFTKSILWKE